MGPSRKNVILILLIKSVIAGILEVFMDQVNTNTSEIVKNILNEPLIYYINSSSSADINNEERCIYLNYNKSVLFNSPYCKWIWDKYLCWPSTPAGSIIRQQCPDFSETITDYYAERICGLDGKWIDNYELPISERNPNGWTNLSNCFRLEIYDLRNNIPEVNEKIDLIKNFTQEVMENFTITTEEALLSTQIENINTNIYYVDHLISSSIDNEYKCLSLNFNQTSIYNAIYCNWTWDKFLCWPSTPAGTIVRQKCPSLIGVIKEHYAERICGVNGRWMGKLGLHTSQHITNGWTNFSNCFRGEVWDLIEKCNKGGNCDEKYEIAKRTRILETVGLILSFFTLLLSLVIFFNFQSLRNSRTKIHKNLFIAMEIQVIIRLIIYFDQKLTRPNVDASQLSTSGIENTPYLCEFLYFLLEYARTAMFMWMLIEGIYLHSGVTWITGTRRFPYIAYAMIGWGAPLLMTAVWEFFTVKYHKGEKCLFNYNLTPYYLILEGPRHAIILLNLIFLLNIIRVLVVKLRQSHSSDLDQVRKAVRAAIVLLPLLGIAHILFYFEPTDKSVIIFAIWSYSAHFLRSFQGFFIALIYCFMNGEVRTAITRSFTIYMSLGNRNWFQRRPSIFSGTSAVPETETQIHNSINKTNSSPRFRSCRKSNKHKNWIFCICFQNQTLEEQPATVAPESVIFELSEH